MYKTNINLIVITAHLLIFAVISPQLLDVDHGVDAASLIDSPHGGDTLILRI